MSKNPRSKRHSWLLGTATSVLALGLLGGTARATPPGLDAALDQLLNSHETSTYSRISTIQLPNSQSLAVYDISFVDKVLPLYYLADRTNATLDVIDTRDNTVAAQIGAFVGVKYKAGPTPGSKVIDNDTSGPDGVQPVGIGEVWVGDGDSSVKVVDLYTQKVVQTISTLLEGHTADVDKRADEMAYDPRDHILVVANNAATPPFITMISTVPEDRHVLGHIVYDKAAGVEASVYDPGTGLFYVNLTQFGDDVNSGAVSVVDPRTMAEVKQFPVKNCNGAGLDLGPQQNLLIGCSLPTASQIISAIDGTLLATIPQVSGSDEVWYNPGDGKFYLGARANAAAQGGPALGVIDAFTNTFVANVATNASAHSVAADRRTGHVYVPSAPIAGDPACAKGCIGVYAAQEQESDAERDLEAYVSDLVGK